MLLTTITICSGIKSSSLLSPELTKNSFPAVQYASTERHYFLFQFHKLIAYQAERNARKLPLLIWGLSPFC
jgi:hypothetical protein